MNALYLIRQDNGKITSSEFLTILGDLPGAENIRKENVFRASAEADYFYEDDRTIIRLDEDQHLIAITGVGKASVHAAYDIQRRYNQPLRLFDMDYTFDIELAGVTSVQEVVTRMKMREQQ